MKNEHCKVFRVWFWLAMTTQHDEKGVETKQAIPVEIL